MNAIWAINPRRKRRRKSGKRARKMTAKQLKYFGGGKRVRRRSRKSSRRRSAGAVSSVKRRYRRRGRSSGRIGSSFNVSSATALLKSGAIGGAGAVAVDVVMGQAQKLLSSALPSMATPANADGTPNYGYYAIKAGVAVALGTMGKRFIPGAYAEKMAEGALVVLAYQFIRPMVPSSLTLGYVNPAPTMRRVGQVGGQAPGAVVGKYLSAYNAIPVRSGNSASRGANAAQVVSLRGGR